ncbi:MAG TPA: hypothetical protein VEC99_03105, partial [Clostridia bacterium]|nr:hypothetical protein [Clostridia bacterium]
MPTQTTDTLIRCSDSTHLGTVVSFSARLLRRAITKAPLCTRSGLVAVSLFVAAGAFAAEPATVTTAKLLEEATDLSGMAVFPSPAYLCKQFSSYDRVSKSPSQDWFANGDAGQYLRVEERAGRKEHVMMDAPGPGAIVRIWSANPAGTLRIYLDGAEQPTIESPMSELL